MLRNHPGSLFALLPDIQARAPGDNPTGPARPGAAAMTTDAESGSEGLDAAEERRRSLHALKVMFERGLIPRSEYDRKVRELGG